MASWLPLVGAQLPLFHTALKATIAGSRNSRILCVGDSTTVGFGAAGNSYVNAKPNSYPDVLATNLTSTTGINAQEVSFFGDNAVTSALTNYPLYDTRLTINGASWSQSGNTTIANFPWRNLTGTDTMSFTPTQQIDTCELYTFVGSGFGTITVDFDGGPVLLTANTNNGGSTNFSRLLTSGGTLGIHTINIKRSTGGAIIYNGVDCYNSAVKRISIFNAGWAGVKAGTLAGVSPSVNNPYSYQNAIPLFTPDLTLLCVGINDWAVPTSISSYTSSMQILINQAKITGDVIIVTPVFSSTSIISQNTQNTFITAMAGLAATNGIPIFYTANISSNWVSYTAANSAGLMYDTVHPNQTGYSQIGMALAAFIMQN